MYEDELSSLAQAAVSGDQQAWSQLQEELSAELYRFCAHLMSSSQQAEEATSEILLKLRLRLPSIDIDRPVRPWAFRLAARHCLELLRARREGSTTTSVASVEGSPAQDDEPIDYLSQDEQRPAIRAGLRQLGDQSRLIVVARYFADLGYDDIAEILGVSSSFVGLTLLRARQQLRRSAHEVQGS